MYLNGVYVAFYRHLYLITSLECAHWDIYAYEIKRTSSITDTPQARTYPSDRWGERLNASKPMFCARAACYPQINK